MYANRLRIDDFERLFDSCGFKVVDEIRDREESEFMRFQNQFKLNARFRDKSPLDLATLSALFVAKQKV